ncbi:MAG: DUF1223 domain-containing protein [Pseudomonadota bacterium]
MRWTLRTSSVFIGFAAMLAPVSFGDSAEELPSNPILAELFTSQSCSSCPPAEALFSELTERDDIVVIEWHVDYWDDLVYGRAGKWEDPYSSSEYTERQRDYNMVLRGVKSVYTPQAIINGKTETTGSRNRAVSQLIRSAPKTSAYIMAEPTSVTVAPLQASSTVDAEVVMVKLLPEQSTDVRGGENKGRTLASRNVAVGTRTIGHWTGEEANYAIPEMPAGYDCAILVQNTATMELYGASYCAVG